MGRTALKNKLKNVSVSETFPSVQVVQAYLEPTVDTSRAKFSWGKPDFTALTEFAKEKFGWSPRKTEEILKPVIKRIEEKQAQMSIKDYFKATFKANAEAVEGKLSKRVKTAIDRIGKTPEELIAEEMEALAKEKQKKTRGKRENGSARKETEDRPPKRQRRKKSGAKTEELEGNPAKSEKTDVPKATPSTENSSTVGDNSEQSEDVPEEPNDLERYENIAKELKKRRQRRNELSKLPDPIVKKKVPPKKKNLAETIPEGLEEDEEIAFLKATTSSSLKRIEEIDEEVKKELDQRVKKKCLPNLHSKKEVIHQKLRDKSDVLRNKLKAIEIFRKSKKGPGYVKKRKRGITAPRDDAGLSESSDE